MTEHLNPSVWELLPAVDAVDQARSDQDARWRAGKPLPVERYLDALPRVAADPEQAMVLIYGEVLSRTAAGEKPTLDEYRRRFPRFADHLAIQFQLHSALHPADAHPTAVPAERLTATTAFTPAKPPPVAVGPPSAIGPYRILGELGRGGMGVVYAAHDPTLDREVAVKTFPPERSIPPQAVARFHREARVSARLQHPSVPPVYAVGEQPDGTPYLSMKRVRGHTLADQLKERANPTADLPRLVGVFEQVCQAVGYAHAHGVIHRDLKPANVMVGEFGEVQVMDWGLAKEVTADETGELPALAAAADPSARTQTGAVLGTPAFMAPEQARGEAIDSRADVFALGGLLGVLLTGRPPFVAPDTPQTVHKARQADTGEAFERLRACGADPELTEIARRCLSGSAADRPADGRAVAELVAAYRAGVADRLRRAETEQAAAAAREVEGRRKRRWRQATVSTVAVLVAAAGLFAWGYDRQAADLAKATAENKAKEAEIAQAKAEGQAKAAEAARVKAESEAHEAALAGRNAEALEVLLAEVVTALAEGDADKAARPLGQAEKRANDLGGVAFAARVARCRKDYDMLRAVDEVDGLYYQNARLIEGKSADPNLVLRALEVFRRYGLTFGTTPPEEAARLIRESLIRETLECAVARGFAIVLSMEREAGLLWPAVTAVFGWPNLSAAEFARYLDAIDDVADPGYGYRSQVRAAMVNAMERKNRGALLELLARPEAANQVPHFLHMIAASGVVPEKRRVAILRESFPRRPRDFRLHFGMGYFLYKSDEAANWLRTAVALRPNNALAWAALADVLHRWADREQGRWDDLQRQFEGEMNATRRVELGSLAVRTAAHRRELFAEAEAAARRATTLAPHVAVYRLQLGMSLGGLEKWAESTHATLWAVALEPTSEKHRRHLGWSLDAVRQQQATVTVVGGGPTVLPLVGGPDAPPAYQVDAAEVNPHYRLGVLLRMTGRVGEAEEEQREALAIDPDNPRVKKELKLLAGLRVLGAK